MLLPIAVAAIHTSVQLHIITNDGKRILCSLCASHKTHSPALIRFACLNGLFPLARSVKDFVNAGPSGVHTLDTAFDLVTLRMRSQVDFTDDAGVTRRLETDERHYLPSELTWYMHTLGMRNASVFGCTAGDFRKCPPAPEHFEQLVLAEKAR